MTRVLDQTHDAATRPWVDSARRTTDFPIQNLPFGVFRRRGRSDAPRLCVGIGDEVVDLGRAVGQGLLAGFDHEAQAALSARVLNPLMALGRTPARRLRHRLFDLLREGAAEQKAMGECLVPLESAELLLPVDHVCSTQFSEDAGDIQVFDENIKDGFMQMQRRTFADSVQPVFDAGLAKPVEGPATVCEGVRLVPTPGHTPGHFSVLVESKGEKALITGDFMHHPIQFHDPALSISADEDNNAAIATRRRVSFHGSYPS